MTTPALIALIDAKAVLADLRAEGAVRNDDFVRAAIAKTQAKCYADLAAELRKVEALDPLTAPGESPAAR